MSIATLLITAGCNVTVNEPAANVAPVSNSQQATASSPAASPNPAQVDSRLSQSAPSANDGNKTVDIHFPAGATEASYTDSFAGYGYVDYVFEAKADQDLTAKFKSSDGNKAILTVLHNGTSVDDMANQTEAWTGTLPSTGKYTVRVGQMRNSARRSEKPVKFTISIKIVD